MQLDSTTPARKGLRMAFLAARPFVSGDCVATLRTAVPDDASALAAFHRQVAGETEFLSREPHEVVGSVDEHRRRMEQHAAREHALMLVAVSEEQIVGSASLHGRPLARFRHQAELGIALRRAVWGQGLGTALLAALCDWADAHGLSRLWLIVTADNTRAVRLYERAGFLTEGRLCKESKLSDGYHDALLMARVRA